jgi:hypothetical protein
MLSHSSILSHFQTTEYYGFIFYVLRKTTSAASKSLRRAHKKRGNPRRIFVYILQNVQFWYGFFAFCWFCQSIGTPLFFIEKTIPA